MRVYQSEPVIETLARQGARLAQGINRAIETHQLVGHVGLHGRPCCLVFSTRDQAKQPSQVFRALLMQELIKRGVIGPSLIVSYSHTDDDIDHTIRAFEGALEVYRRALNEGVEHHLVGHPTQSVYRRYNDFALDRLPSTQTGLCAGAPADVAYIAPTNNRQ